MQKLTAVRSFFLAAVTALSLLGTTGCTPSKKADTKKIIRIPIGDDPKTLDPGQSSDQNSSDVIGLMFEGLLRFSYLGPAGKVEPNLAASLPVVKDQGTTYIFNIQKGVKFHDDAAFPGGKGREVTAEDFVYSFKRIADPALLSPNWWMFDGMIVGLNEWREKLKAAKKEERGPILKESVEGLKATALHTLELKLTKAYPQLLQILSMTHASVVAQEIVEKYGEEIGSRPVGTGAYQLKNWTRGLSVIVEKNPNYRQVTYPNLGSDEDRQAGLLEAAGKRLPFAEEIHNIVYKEEQPRWLNFMQGNLDITRIPKDNFADTISESGELNEEMVANGFLLKKRVSMTTWWIEFNMKDEFLGKHKLVRQALAHAFDRERALKLLYNNRGVLAGGAITPTLEGGKTVDAGRYSYDVEKAKALLKQAGFEDGKGIPELTFELRGAGVTNRQLGELMKANFEEIGVKLAIQGNSFSEALQKMKEARFQIMLSGWAADYPDPENFLQLFYSQNAAPGPNSSNFKNKRFDELYEKIRTERPSPSRLKSISEMNKILQDEVPVAFFFHSMNYTVHRSWLKNYAPHDFLYGTARFWDIDLQEKQKILK